MFIINRRPKKYSLSFSDGQYARLAKLANGKYLYTADARYRISSDGGQTYSSATVFAKENIVYNEKTYQVGLANAQPLVLSNGQVLMFFRCNTTITLDNGQYVHYTSIRAKLSLDNGVHFGDTFVLLENWYGPTSSSDNGGVYEPFGVEDSDGSVKVYISCDLKNSSTHPELTNSGNAQRTVLIPITVNGTNIVADDPQVITNLMGKSGARPGMTVVEKMNDGNYAMVLENTSNKTYGFVIQMSFSKDLVNWTSPVDIVLPNKTGKSYKCQAPYIAMLPDGRAAVSYMTTDGYHGKYSGSSDFYRTQQIAISDGIISYNNASHFTKVASRVYADDEGCQFGSCAFIDQILYSIGRSFTVLDNNVGTTSNPAKSSGTGKNLQINNIVMTKVPF